MMFVLFPSFNWEEYSVFIYYHYINNLSFFQASIEERNITDVLRLLQLFGNWPVLSSNWSELSFNLEDLLINIRQYTIKTPIFRIAPAADVKNSDVRIIYVSTSFSDHLY